MADSARIKVMKQLALSELSDLGVDAKEVVSLTIGATIKTRDGKIEVFSRTVHSAGCLVQEQQDVSDPDQLHLGPTEQRVAQEQHGEEIDQDQEEVMVPDTRTDTPPFKHKSHPANAASAMSASKQGRQRDSDTELEQQPSHKRRKSPAVCLFGEEIGSPAYHTAISSRQDWQLPMQSAPSSREHHLAAASAGLGPAGAKVTKSHPAAAVTAVAADTEAAAAAAFQQQQQHVKLEGSAAAAAASGPAVTPAATEQGPNAPGSYHCEVMSYFQKGTRLDKVMVFLQTPEMASLGIQRQYIKYIDEKIHDDFKAELESATCLEEVYELVQKHCSPEICSKFLSWHVPLHDL